MKKHIRKVGEPTVAICLATNLSIHTDLEWLDGRIDEMSLNQGNVCSNCRKKYLKQTRDKES